MPEANNSIKPGWITSHNQGLNMSECNYVGVIKPTDVSSFPSQHWIPVKSFWKSFVTLSFKTTSEVLTESFFANTTQKHSNWPVNYHAYQLTNMPSHLFIWPIMTNAKTSIACMGLIYRQILSWLFYWWLDPSHTLPCCITNSDRVIF
jgi:hypothetical protein